MKKFDKKHFIAIGITVIFALCGFIYSTAILRFFESLKDVGLSIAYYFIEIFSMLTGGENFITPGVINVSEVVNINTAFPLLWDDFAAKMSVFWQQLTNADNFASYLSSINQILFTFLLVVLLVLPFAVLFYFTAKWLLVSHSKRNAGENSKPLRLFLKLEKKTAPFFDSIKAFAKFVKNNKVYCRLWLIIWLLNLNVLSIIFEAAAYLIYFVSSFDVTNVYLQVYKLSMDVALMTNSLPVFVWVVICYFVIDKLRKKIGLNRLHRYENRNKGFINSLNLVIMITGSMGSKKTTTLTDIMLSQEAIFRDKAFDLLKENDMKFPLFPWSVFEKELNKVISYRQIFNLTSCRSWVNKKRIRFEKSPSPEKLFGYDFSVHPLYAEGELKTEYIFDVLETYAQLYFIYTVESSLLVSNYSVRTDNEMLSAGHFPMWDTDFFRRFGNKDQSEYSHILNFDFLRLGKKVGDNSSGVFEFGVVGITEIGKERGNMVELQGVEKMSNETNQKNDLFNYSLKMARHKATVDNYPFVRFYTDEQRASSWSADGKELCTLLNIADVSDETLAMPFFFVEELLHDFVFGKFMRLYYDYRFCRSDNILTLHLLKRFIAFAHKKYVAIHDKYGFFRSAVETQAGTLTEDVSRHKYFLCKKKIYADRFSTDCYSEILTSEKTNAGINEIPVYNSTKPTVDEFRQQNSYFIRELLRIGKLADENVCVSDDFMQLYENVKETADYEKIVADAYKAYKKDIAKRAIADLDRKSQ